MRNMRRIAIGVVLAGSMWAVGCVDQPRIVEPPVGPPEATIWSGVVSDPVFPDPGGFSSGGLALTPDVVYISLAPGTIPDGETAVITNRRTGGAVTATVVDGGFDPIAAAGRVGDTLDIAVHLVGTDSLHSFIDVVTLRRAPVVVRTEPPPRKRDVPLNAVMLVVFSEPIDGRTITAASIRLFVGAQQVSGRLVVSADGLRVEFQPDSSLAPGAEYTLSVAAVADVDGDVLEQPLAVSFTTATGLGSVASVTVTPTAATFVAQAVIQLTATLRDTNGAVVSGHSVTWRSSDEGVATVDANGLVTGVSEGSAVVTATSDAVSDTAAMTVALIRFASGINAGGTACALTTTGAAFCWGGNNSGALGYGWFGGSGSFSPAPVAVAGELVFTTLSDGAQAACGVVTTGAAYCWGSNAYGQLGNGSSISSPVPVPVVGGLHFSLVSAGGGHACGITTSGAAYCWGNNFSGQLGDGSTTSSSVPIAVSGGLAFTTVTTVGGWGGYSCGVSTTGAAYCWGENFLGQLGNGTTTNSPVPVPVSGGLSFSALSAGGITTCGITISGAAYCWGYNSLGQFGNGSTTSSSVPTLAAAGLTFLSLSVGSNHTCGVTTGGAAYCWGDNRIGQLGNGDVLHWDTLEPVAVSGGLTFTAVSAARNGMEGHTCGLTTSGTAYCWGMNLFGQLGNGFSGPSSHSDSPVKVAGQP